VTDAAASADSARSRSAPLSSVSAGSAVVSITPRRSSRASMRTTMVCKSSATTAPTPNCLTYALAQR
jgi:hypothetical protein